MSLLYCHAKTGEIIYIVENSTFDTLKKYFTRFSLQARNKVKPVDMYSLYVKLIMVFSRNSRKFHVIKLLSRALNKSSCIQMMK